MLLVEMQGLASILLRMYERKGENESCGGKAMGDKLYVRPVDLTERPWVQMTIYGHICCILITLFQ